MSKVSPVGAWPLKAGPGNKMNKISVVALLAAAASLNACEFAQNAVAPSITGQPATSQAAATPQRPATAPGEPGKPGAGLATGHPFVVIRFDQPGLEYRERLYEAVNAALARSPGVAFDLVAVAPAGGTPEQIALNSKAARADMEQVQRSLLDMGLPADRVSATETTDPKIEINEVRLYVR
jgi:hypothetical protein